jgi:hypothetical protein
MWNHQTKRWTIVKPSGSNRQHTLWTSSKPIVNNRSCARANERPRYISHVAYLGHGVARPIGQCRVVDGFKFGTAVVQNTHESFLIRRRAQQNICTHAHLISTYVIRYCNLSINGCPPTRNFIGCPLSDSELCNSSPAHLNQKWAEV